MGEKMIERLWARVRGAGCAAQPSARWMRVVTAHLRLGTDGRAGVDATNVALGEREASDGSRKHCKGCVLRKSEMSDVIERRPFDSVLDDLQIPFARVQRW